MWDRARLGSLFDFDFVWELFHPLAKRRWGWYVLPIAFGDRFVGRSSPGSSGPTPACRCSRSGGILVAAVAAVAMFNVALDETRFDDIPFFVVLGLFLVGIGLLARWAASRVIRPREAGVQ